VLDNGEGGACANTFKGMPSLARHYSEHHFDVASSADGLVERTVRETRDALYHIGTYYIYTCGEVFPVEPRPGAQTTHQRYWACVAA